MYYKYDIHNLASLGNCLIACFTPKSIKISSEPPNMT